MKRPTIFKVMIFCVIAMAFLVSNGMAATPTTTPGTCTLSLTIAAIDGRGSVEVNPPGEVFTGRTTKIYTYPINTVVTLKAIDYSFSDGAKNIFYRWQGDLTGNQNPTTIVMNGNKSVTAVFVHADPLPSPRRVTPTATPARQLTPTPTRRIPPSTGRDVRRTSRTPTPRGTISPTPTRRTTVTPTPTIPQQWIPYLPTADMVKITYAPGESLMHVDITFGSSGYRIADPGQVAVAAGVNPDGTTYMSNITVGTKIEEFTGPHLAVITTLRITYKVSSGDTTYFGFRVNYGGQEVLVKEITVKKVPVSATPTPTVISPTPTPTRSPGSIVVKYEIVSDWGTGATISITIINNTPTDINGWTLVFTFPGNQTITSIWNASMTQSGASISLKNISSNGVIPANGGSVNFGFTISYSGTNSKPTGFTLNGIPCQVQ